MAPCTWDPANAAASCILTNGNLTASSDIARSVRGNVGYGDVKRHFEIAYDSNAGAPQVALPGIATSAFNYNSYVGAGGSDSWGWYEGSGGILFATVDHAYSANEPHAGDVVGVVVDPIVGTLAFYLNGASQGTYVDAGLIGLTVFPAWGAGSGSGNRVVGTLRCAAGSIQYPMPGIAWDGTPGAGSNFFALI